MRVLLFSSRVRRVYFDGGYLSPQSIVGNCGGLVRFSAPFFSLAFIVGTSHHDGAKTLLARVGATAAEFIVAAPSDARI